ncbi:quinol:cytochrome C oxidoreductase [Mucilaginibacter rubeus]|uniref:Quinol:cytochrome C oxidoreductase n=1 Tax=Mucilaginibacter rubeus TaxID=2027860 RepID=A0A5C1I7H1_9SPHI|nr:quinol:cytochrome C oxidoreductase [Mucilaginibacter rubeus]QEM13987.1 quinol:cytochrome C oxidoreductase [Mucilaginibacter rubeus]
MKTHNNFDGQYEFVGKAKTWSLICIVIGLVAILGGFALGYTERTFANLLLMTYYFAAVCMCGIFFCAVQYAAQAGWSASMIRIPQAFGKVLPIAAVTLILVVIAGFSLTHTVTNEEGKQVVAPYLYKIWAAVGVTDPHSENYNAIIAGKAGYMNKVGFVIRLICFLGSYCIFGRLLAKYSEAEDDLGGMFYYKRSFNMSCLFLVIFGFTTPIYAFDTIMSLEAEWFSTMFGWYNFAAMWVSGLSVITLTLIRLKRIGYFEWVSEDHMHSLTKFIFGFSIFWTYVWFAQFLLIYYANMPEETVYFFKRWEPEFKPWFWINIVVNFLTPLLVLMSRDSKRIYRTVEIMCIILIVGHWLDYFMMIMPGTVGPTSSWLTEIGPIEIGVFVGFGGLFTFTAMTALTKFKSLVPKKHPFLQESLHHHI